MRISISNEYVKQTSFKKFVNEKQTVEDIIDKVKEFGDEALFGFAKKFDGLDLSASNIKVSQEEIDRAVAEVPKKLMKALEVAAQNILDYHKKQMPKDSFDGKTGWKFSPIEKVGLYVPGGTAAYPSTVLMAALPAIAAGVKEICIATPGKIQNPLILAAAKLCGIKTIYKMGGAQAIAALAYGTESVEKVDFIAGPGNIYVTLAKKAVFGDVGIDSLAGPSDIAILADDTANAKYIARDMLAQAEHDENAQAVLVTTCEAVANETARHVEEMMALSLRREVVEKSIKKYGQIILADSLEKAIEIINQIAPEHLEIMTKNPDEVCKKIINAGAIFLGEFTPEAVGDYYAGPSHILPTGGNARFSEVVNVATFLKRISLIKYAQEDLRAGAEDIMLLAEAEELHEHGASVRERICNE